MRSLGQLEVLESSEVKVAIRSIVIQSHMLDESDENHIPTRYIPVTVDGRNAVVLQPFLIGRESDHIVFAIKETGLSPRRPALLFVAYKLVGGKWQQYNKIVRDPDGTLKRDVIVGWCDTIANLHKDYLGCCN